MKHNLFRVTTITFVLTIVLALVLNSDLASVRADSGGKIITVDNIKQVKKTAERDLNSQVERIAISPDGKALAIGDAKGGLLLQDFATGKEIRTFKGQKGGISALAFSPDGTILASGAGDGTVQLWNVSTGKQMARLTGHRKYVPDLAFSQDGKLLITIGSDTSGKDKPIVRLWSVPGGKLLKNLATADAVEFSSDAFFLGNQDNVGKYDIATKEEIGEWSIESRYILVTSDGKALIASDAKANVQVVDAATAKEISAFEVPLDAEAIGGVDDLASNPDGTIIITKELALGGKKKGGKIDIMTLHGLPGNDLVTLWNSQTGEMLIQVEVGKGPTPASMLFTPDGTALVVASSLPDDKGVLQIWTIED